MYIGEIIMEKQGNIQINSQNLMPIIKRWLYSDKDIFLRELISNGCDAMTKLKKLESLGKAEIKEELCIKIDVDKENKTLSITDSGLGMTAEEVEKYITQVAFSGAEDFLKKYEDTNGDGIIGHFGLGFYSSYMVAKVVKIQTLSYESGATGVEWESDGNETYSIKDANLDKVGTKITLYLSDGEEEFLEDGKLRELLQKYCMFMPYNIYLNYKDGEENKPLNNTTPLYLKDPKEVKDEEYIEFYKNTFSQFEEPLFWLHLNVDYPFNLKGILYFPKIKENYDINNGQVKLFCNQVFIADNIKEIIPEYLLLLKGVIDCPDIPLNVSRSFLQNDREVAKISKHITKKVADKLTSMYKNEREKYEKCWNDIHPFIKFGALKEEDFYDKIKDIMLFENTNGKFKSLSEIKGDGESEVKVYYTSDRDMQASYISMYEKDEKEVYYLEHPIDKPLINALEYKNEKLKFSRVDSTVLSSEDTTISEEEKNSIAETFKEVLGEELNVKIESLKDESLPVTMLLTEESRRMREMLAMYGNPDMLKESEKDYVLVLNSNNDIIKNIKNAQDKQSVVKFLYGLAKIQSKKLSASEFKDFISASSELLKKNV